MANTQSIREKERKYVVVTQETHSAIDDLLRKTLKRKKPEVIGLSTDSFFNPPATSSSQFIRLREHQDGKAELTIKSKDKGNNYNRLEINVEVNSLAMMRKMLENLHGPALLELEKSYTVFFLKDEVLVSTYRVIGDERLFLEVEAPTLKLVDETVSLLKNTLELELESKSLFEIFSPTASRMKKIGDT